MKYSILIVLLYLTACNMERNAEQDENDDHVSYSERDMAEGELWNEQEVEEFAGKAAMFAMTEVIVGQMAQQKATDDEIGLLGEMMYEDHSQSLANLRDLALRENITLPDTLSDDIQTTVASFQTLDGQEFDRTFIERTEEAHRKSIALYEEAEKNMLDTNPMKEWVDNSLPALRRHLQKSQQLQYQQNIDIN